VAFDVAAFDVVAFDVAAFDIAVAVVHPAGLMIAVGSEPFAN
jgi:hypothetical protein